MALSPDIIVSRENGQLVPKSCQKVAKQGYSAASPVPLQIGQVSATGISSNIPSLSTGL
jgi:hypothetical protein